MNIGIDGNNFFHTGWLACFCGLPRKHPSELSLKPFDLEAFYAGWDTCDETGDLIFCMDAFNKMLNAGQITAEWQDDNGEPIEVKK